MATNKPINRPPHRSKRLPDDASRSSPCPLPPPPQTARSESVSPTSTSSPASSTGEYEDGRDALSDSASSSASSRSSSIISISGNANDTDGLLSGSSSPSLSPSSSSSSISEDREPRNTSGSPSLDDSDPSSSTSDEEIYTWEEPFDPSTYQTFPDEDAAILKDFKPVRERCLPASYNFMDYEYKSYPEIDAMVLAAARDRRIRKDKSRRKKKKKKKAETIAEMRDDKRKSHSGTAYESIAAKKLMATPKGRKRAGSTRFEWSEEKRTFQQFTTF